MGGTGLCREGVKRRCRRCIEGAHEEQKERVVGDHLQQRLGERETLPGLTKFTTVGQREKKKEWELCGDSGK